ncbi:PilZ domain-containing protein [Spirochaeta africana]|uniref:PilZ domain-containing protein n=1 Tax=Spirochaeta africana (strain ATCC 700263 / DSM 8902 / Z-7692) TaxID=889378 RepID=H9UFN4_SPIAZ|nr:PilZ domain-containing protein [Spirochaeta africana]AFG36327.1 PilZ domain-containing protein [Spirochaeta africana DSM 8902]
MSIADRRRFTRLPFHSSGTISTAAVRIPFALEDISLKGALVRLSPEDTRALEALPEDTGLQFDLELPAAEQDIQATAVIAHRQDLSIGLEFTMIDIDSITMLRRLLELNSGDPDSVDREIRELGQ